MSWPNVERQIDEARQRGEFDNLPGAGKPLDLSDADDPNWWIKRFMQRERLSLAEAMPPMLALRKQADGFPQTLAGLPDAAAVREVLAAYNDAVKREIARPATGPTMPVVAHTIDIDAMVLRWQTECRGSAVDPQRATVLPRREPEETAEPTPEPAAVDHPEPQALPPIEEQVFGTATGDSTAPEAAEKPAWWRRILLGE